MSKDKPLQATVENLREFAVEPMTAWLIHAAQRKAKVHYNEAKHRLEKEHGFSKIFPVLIGRPAGIMMEQIFPKFRNPRKVPLLNVLLVRSDTGLPGRGAGPYMADKFGDDRLRRANVKSRLWKDKVAEAAEELYNYTEWDGLFQKMFGAPLPPDDRSSEKAKERDGIAYGRNGEGKNHKALRLWVRNNPQRISRRFAKFQTETEYVLESADRVDVVYFSANPLKSVVLEVKSKDSNENEDDLRRGIFQCIKYRAVMNVMNKERVDYKPGIRNVNQKPETEAILVTQTKLPSHLKRIARENGIRLFVAPMNIGGRT